MGASHDVRGADLPSLVERALHRDEGAWAELVARLQRVVWKSVNLATFNEQVRREAFGATWLRLAEHLASIREPEKLAGWLAVTATREAIALSRAEQRSTATDGALLAGWPVAGTSDDSPPELAERREAVAVVRRGLAQLGDPCRELLTMLLVLDPPLSYAEVAERFGRPHGWIGPTRERCIEKLRRMPEVAALVAGGRA